MLSGISRKLHSCYGNVVSISPTFIKHTDTLHCVDSLYQVNRISPLVLFVEVGPMKWLA